MGKSDRTIRPPIECGQSRLPHGWREMSKQLRRYGRQSIVVGSNISSGL
jgi:hypothetical protein